MGPSFDAARRRPVPEIEGFLLGYLAKAPIEGIGTAQDPLRQLQDLLLHLGGLWRQVGQLINLPVLQQWHHHQYKLIRRQIIWPTSLKI